jgi:uncharacterized protein with PIN domain
VDGSVVGIPHFSVIESRAHELGRALSRQVQQRQTGETVALAARRVKCPTCSRTLELIESKRLVTSIDGEFEMQELHGHCPVCRRDFFPSPGAVGV